MADDASVTDAYAQLFDDSDVEDEDMLDIDHDLPHDDSEIRDESHIDDNYRPPHNQLYVPSTRPASMSVDDNPEHHQGQRRSEDLEDDGLRMVFGACQIEVERREGSVYFAVLLPCITSRTSHMLEDVKQSRRVVIR